MNDARMTVAELDKKRLAKLQAAEKDLGVCLVALTPQYPLAELGEEQVAKVQDLERELGVVLLAYRKA